MSVEGFLLQRKRERNEHDMYQLIINKDVADPEMAEDYMQVINNIMQNLDKKDKNGPWWIGCPPGIYWKKAR